MTYSLTCYNDNLSVAYWQSNYNYFDWCELNL